MAEAEIYRIYLKESEVQRMGRVVQKARQGHRISEEATKAMLGGCDTWGWGEEVGEERLSTF